MFLPKANGLIGVDHGEGELRSGKVEGGERVDLFRHDSNSEWVDERSIKEEDTGGWPEYDTLNSCQ